MQKSNLFEVQMPLNNEEIETILLSHSKSKIKKIISPANFKSELFCQSEDEWVCLIEGEATLLVGEKPHLLSKGSSLFIPSMTPHQILKTSSKPLAIWLAFYL